MGEKLNKWLIEQMNEKGWSQRKLGTEAGFTGAHVSNVLAGHSQPTWDFCAGVARALGVHPVEVFIIAGLMSPPIKRGDLEPDEAELIRLYHELDPFLQALMLNHFKQAVEQAKKRRDGD